VLGISVKCVCIPKSSPFIVSLLQSKPSKHGTVLCAARGSANLLQPILLCLDVLCIHSVESCERRILASCRRHRLLTLCCPSAQRPLGSNRCRTRPYGFVPMRARTVPVRADTVPVRTAVVSMKAACVAVTRSGSHSWVLNQMRRFASCGT